VARGALFGSLNIFKQVEQHAHVGLSSVALQLVELVQME
jgi:hypothetical protein